MFNFFIVVRIQLSSLSCHHYPHRHLPPPPTLHPSPLWLCPWVLHTCCLMTLSLLSPVISLPPPFWSLSVYSLFPCLWLYFACLFVLLVSFPSKWVDLKTVLHVHDGILHSRKKEGAPTLLTAWMELERIMLSEGSQGVKGKYQIISPISGT